MTKTVILTFLLLLQIRVVGCDCIWGGSFLNSIEKDDYILVGQVIGYDQYSRSDAFFRSWIPSVMIIEVKEIIVKGRDSGFEKKLKLKEGISVKVLGNISSDCRPDISRFRKGSEWVFKLNRAIESNYYHIDFLVSNCATNYLKLDDNVVFGNIKGKNQRFESDCINTEMSLDDFKREIVACTPL